MVALLKRQLKETISILKGFKGNARGCLITEPLWGIPYNLFIAYASVYMIALGCSEIQVGFIASIGLVLQAFFSLISGYITDKWGRRRTSLVFDIISWSSATLIWAIAQNFYFFLIAAIVNSCGKVVYTSWYCLMIEDTEPEERVNIFTWISVAGILAGFFAPAAGLLIKALSLVPAMRILYIFAFISMTFMFIYRNHLTHETKIGLIKMQETKGHKFDETLKDYLRVAAQLLKNKYTIIAFTLLVFNNIQLTLKNSFLSILLAKGLDFPVESIAIFPAINTIVVLAVYIFVMPALGRLNSSKPLAFGFAASTASNLLLALSPEKSFVAVIAATVLGAIGSAAANPFIETVVANSVAEGDRSKIMSILNVILFIVVAPFGYVGGVLSTISERLPFVFIALVFASAIMVVAILSRMKKRRTILAE